MTILQTLSGTTALTLFAFAVAAGAADATPVGTTATFTFNGDCDDCAGALVPFEIPGIGEVSNLFHARGDGQVQHVTGTLMLSNFTPGVEMTAANFVSFQYNGSSVLAPFTVTAPRSFSATLDANGNLLSPFNLYWSSPNIFLAGSPFGDFCGYGGEGPNLCWFTVGTGGAWAIISLPPADIGINGTFANAAVEIAEPLSIALFGSGLLGLGAALRRRRDDAETERLPLGWSG